MKSYLYRDYMQNWKIPAQCRHIMRLFRPVESGRGRG